MMVGKMSVDFVFRVLFYSEENICVLEYGFRLEVVL